MNVFTSNKSVRLLVLLASILPTALISGQALATTLVVPVSEPAISESTSVQFSDKTAAKLQFFGGESEQLAAKPKPFVQENGPTFVRKIRPFVRENGPSFVQSISLDSPDQPYAAAPTSAVDAFAALQRNLELS